MKILGLDLSTHIGWAVLDEDGPVLVSGSHDVPSPPLHSESEDYGYLHRANMAADFIESLIDTHSPDYVCIEQTNIGRNRMSQKLLEFIHFAVLERLREKGLATKVGYADTSMWRSGLKLALSKEQKQQNKEVRAAKKVGKRIPKKTKVGWKHLAVAWVNLHYGLTLRMKDNDEADAICLASWASKSLKERPALIDASVIDQWDDDCDIV